MCIDPQLLIISVIEMMEQQSNDYEVRLHRMYKYPACYQEALIHKKATKFGYSNPKMKDKSDTPICPCCESYVNTVQIPLDYPTEPNVEPHPGSDVFLLPTSISLYFTFIKMMIMYVVLRFLTVDLFNLLTTFVDRLCLFMATRHSKLGKFCLRYLYHLFSTHQEHQADCEQSVLILAFLNLAFSLLAIIYFIWYQKYSYQLYYFLEQNDVTQDDFSILVEGVPPLLYDRRHTTSADASFNYRKIIKQHVQDKVREWVEDLSSKRSEEIEDLPYLERDFFDNVLSKKDAQRFKKYPVVHTISICSDLTELQNLNRVRNQLADTFVNKMRGKEYDRNSPERDLLEHIPNQIKIVNSKYIEVCHLIGQDDHPCYSLSRFVGRAFITFEYQHYRDLFMREYDKNSRFLTFNNGEHCSKISLAPKPNDVFWYNMKVPQTYRLKHTFYSYFIMILSLLFLLGGLIALSIWKEHVAKKMPLKSLWQKTLSFSFNLLMVLLTYTINVTLGIVLDKLTEMQRCQSKTKKMSSLLLKNVIAKVLNTTVVYFILYQMNPTDPMAKEGLSSKVMGLLTFSAQLKIVNDLFQPVSFIKKLFAKKLIFSPEREINMFQIQLNQAVQKNEFNLPNQYSYYIFVIYLVSFYSMITPFSNITLILLFSIQYWVDKYVLFKHMSSPVDFGYRLSSLIHKCFEGSILVFAIGHFYWNSRINPKSPELATSINIANIVLTASYILVSYFCPLYLKQRFFGKVFMPNITLHSYSFFLKTNRISKFYWKQNPATSYLKEHLSSKEDHSLSVIPNNVKTISCEFIKEDSCPRFLEAGRPQIQVDVYGDGKGQASSEGSISRGVESSNNDYLTKMRKEGERTDKQKLL